MALLDPGSRVVRLSEPIVAEFPNGCVVLSMEESKYFGLNVVGEAIWRRMERPISVGALGESLAEEFDIAPERATDAVRTFVSRLVRHRIASVQS